jgi:hypothetical protein
MLPVGSSTGIPGPIAAAIGSTWAAGFLTAPLMRATAYSIILICLLFLMKILRREDLQWIKGLVYRK